MKAFKNFFLLKLIFVSAISVIMAISYGCNNNRIPTENENAYKIKPFVINLEGGDWGYPSPFSHYYRGPGVYKMNLVFDSLLERSENNYIPWLAKSYDISADGLAYTFTIRKNIKWHDGTNLTAEDIKFSFEYFEKFPPVFNDLTIDGEDFIQSIDIVDSKTVRFNVKKPYSIILGKIGIIRIIPKHIWEDVNDPYKFINPEAVIGTGPYILKVYNKEHGTYKFEAFKDFWGPKQIVDIIQFVPVSDSILAFNRGEIDLTEICPDILPQYQGSNEYRIIKNPAFWGYRLIFNMEKRPDLKYREIRQAFAYAIDKTELVEKVARGAAVTGSAGFLPEGHILYNPDIKKYGFNIEKAKQLLSGKKISFTLLTGNSNAEVRIAELIKISLHKADIDISITSTDNKTRDAAIKNKNYEIVLMGHGNWGIDADQLRAIHTNEITTNLSPSADGIPGYKNNTINKLCSMQLYELNPEKRKETIFKLQELIAEEIPQIPLYNTTPYIVFRPEKFNGWKYMFDHHDVTHNKLSYLDVKNE